MQERDNIAKIAGLGLQIHVIMYERIPLISNSKDQTSRTVENQKTGVTFVTGILRYLGKKTLNKQIMPHFCAIVIAVVHSSINTCNIISNVGEIR